MGGSRPGGNQSAANQRQTPLRPFQSLGLLPSPEDQCRITKRRCIRPSSLISLYSSVPVKGRRRPDSTTVFFIVEDNPGTAFAGLTRLPISLLYLPACTPCVLSPLAWIFYSFPPSSLQ
ncbi:hypothetical protein BDW75DRAFT_71516 [Aspergillus navahoensis]